MLSSGGAEPSWVFSTSASFFTGSSLGAGIHVNGAYPPGVGTSGAGRTLLVAVSGAKTLPERDTTIEAPEAAELSLYVLNGSAMIGDTALGEAQMAVLNPVRPFPVKLTAGTRIMFAGGDPLDGPRFLDWNFVASSKERLAKAAADWRASIAGGFRGTWFTQPPEETTWIPLPGDPQPSPMDHIPDDHHDDRES